MKNERKYIPINCGFYDELEAAAVKKKNVSIIYIAEDKTAETMGMIENIYSKNNIEFLLLSSGIKIRLDDIVSLDGKRLSNYC